MPTKTPEFTDRKPRADAQRNRERILEVAKKEFTRSGANASLEEIAKKADVGPGTLYRHFPTREKLVVSVWRNSRSPRPALDMDRRFPAEPRKSSFRGGACKATKSIESRSQ